MKIILFCCFVLGMFICTSCEDDGYSPGKFWLTTGTITKDTESYYVVTDQEEKLWPSVSNVNSDLLEDGMRVLLNYTILGEGNDSEYDFYVRVNQVSQILTKPVFEFRSDVSSHIIDSIGNDPVTILDTWFTDDYLNVEFEYGGAETVHYINLVYDDENAETENGEIILELKHNANDDRYNYRQWGIASFDVSMFKELNDGSVDFFLRSKGSSGDYYYNKVLTFVYEGSQEAIMSKRSFRDRGGAQIK